jgi:hypothetical protein
MAMGWAGAVATVFAVVGWCSSSAPGSWWDRNLNVLVVSLAPFGAFAAVVVSLGISRSISHAPTPKMSSVEPEPDTGADAR